MSTPPFLDLPAGAVARPLRTARGDFATLDTEPASGPSPAGGTALLLPGYTGSKEDFIALLAPLTAAGHRVVAVDLRGQHGTGGPRDEAVYALPELAADVLAMADALIGADGRPVHLLGHSWGGLIGRAALLLDSGLGTDPEITDDAPTTPASSSTRFASWTAMSSGPAALQDSEVARTKLLVDGVRTLPLDVLWPSVNPNPPADAAIGEFLRRRWLGTVPEALIAGGEQLVQEPDRVAALATLPLPKLVLSGSTDWAWPVPWQDDMARRLGARRVVVDGAGHSPNTERPTETAGHLTAFWHEVGRDRDQG
ncbi:alpha/beta fold hydrolase [Allostreptomyces psammosilenae]|uniref:Pimeloyl-ACP methyl ester carboxylesterase n=1 Tax=Allostreptomyces psammosilenae TaxID=1892865 RepID=A0A853ACB8_9ACTN|nr:alpha/beta fold hydrolase [Allostreptomyces psammosilenae]NYI08108.1 pimeloyl-ACP methyl ester carboxylesterase [Allostreptomyces psammosilenae]